MTTIGQSYEQPFRWFKAVVEDVKSDPEQLGRVKIRILNQHDFDEVTTEELLYAHIVMPAYQASYQKVGKSPTGLEIGTRCVGFFIDGDRKQTPYIFGTTHHIPGREVEKHDVHDNAREKQALPLKDEATSGHADAVKEPPAPYAAKYYDNKTWTTSQGHAMEIDDTSGEERLHVYHKNGTYIEISKDKTVVKNQNDYYEIDVKNKKVLIKGDYTLEIDGNVTEHIGGNLTRNVKGNQTVNVQGNMDYDVQGVVTIKGRPIHLNP